MSCIECYSRPIKIKKRKLCRPCYQKAWYKTKGFGQIEAKLKAQKIQKEKEALNKINKICVIPNCFYTKYYIEDRCYKHWEKLTEKRRKKIHDHRCLTKSRQRLKNTLKKKYGSEILKDYRKLLKITSNKKLADISNKYDFSQTRASQIFMILFKIDFNKLKDRRRNYYKKIKNKQDKIMSWYKERNYSRYKIFAHQLTVDEKPINDQYGYMKIKCTYCGQYFYPTILSINNRIAVLNDRISSGESRLYCSDNCKQACPIFNRRWFQGAKKEKLGSSREVQPQLRQMVLERDNYECQKCGLIIKEAQLHCHHIEGIEQNPLESADMDLCITFCKDCHMEVHRQEGCKRHQLRKKDLCG